MKSITIFLLLLCNSAMALLEDDAKKQAYSFGYVLAKQLKHDLHSIDNKNFIAGVADGMQDNTPKLNASNIDKYISQYKQEQLDANSKKIKKNAQENHLKNTAFISKLKLNPNVKELQDGLYYEIIKQNDGKKPHYDSRVKVHYTGKLIDGTIFDSTNNKSPVVFALNQVIKGWQQALQAMPVGSVWKIYIEPTLAYGEHGIPGSIPPNSLLIFEVELLEIVV